MMQTDAVIIKTKELNPELDIDTIEKVYKEVFKTVGKVLATGKKPGVIITGLITFDLSRGRLKYKALKLVELILSENLDKLKTNFYICSIEEAREELSSTIAIYKMRKLYDKQNILSKTRKTK